MSIRLLLGTGTPPATYLLRRRGTSEGDVRVTDDGAVRICYRAPVAVYANRVTVFDEDQRVTMAGDRRTVLYGLPGAGYYTASDVSSDGGEDFSFYCKTNPWQPDAQGGECVFAWAAITFSWSMAATVRIQPIVDGVEDDTILESAVLTDYLRFTENGDQRTTMNGYRRVAYTEASGVDAYVETIRPVFVLDQQGGTLQRKRAVFMVPLVRRMIRDGVELSRYYLRGQEIQFLVESVGVLGVGELILEGIELEFTPVRKAIYNQAEATR